VLLLVAACGGSPPAPLPAGPSAVPRPAATGELELELPPVARPAGVIGIGRVRAPGELFARLGQSYESFVGDLAHGFGDLADPAAPLDWIVALERDPAGPVPRERIALSIGLRSGDALRSRELHPDAPSPCVVARSAGVAPARLVCGSPRAALDELLPYATRGLAREPPPDPDVRFDLEVAELRALHAERFARLERWATPFLSVILSNFDPRLDRALAPLLRSGWTEMLELLGDVDRVEVEATVPGTHAEITARARLGRDARALTTSGITQAERTSEPAPEAFWRLPKAAHVALFTRGTSAERAELLRKTLSGALLRAARTPVSRSTVDLIALALFPEPPTVYAFGVLEPLLDLRADRGTQIRRHTERVLGWHVAAIESDPVPLGKRLDAGMREYNAGPLRQFVYGEFPRLCRGLPKITRHAPAGKGLPAGSVLYRMQIPGKLFDDCASWYAPAPRTSSPSLDVVLVFVPGRPRSWIVIAPDESFALQTMRELVRGAPEGSLATVRAELAPLEQPALFGLALSSELATERSLGLELELPRSRLALGIAPDGPRGIVIRARLPRALLAPEGQSRSTY
jgi:hypothetical protein